MRIANLSGRLVLIAGGRAVDVWQASPVTTVQLPPGGHTDWEIELVVVIGARAWQVAESDAWGHVAGLTPDEFADPDNLGLRATINGEEVQKARTSELIFPVPALISRLSARLPLLPGDVIFTGTPAGVGLGRDPQRWLADGDELVSAIEGIGELRQRFTA